MSEKKLIEIAFVELKKAKNGYLMISDISIVKETNSPEYTRKAHFILFYSKYFINHSDSAIKFSEFGLDVSLNFETIEKYEKSLKKPDYLKITTTVVAVLTFFIVSFTYFRDNEKNQLKEELEYKNTVIDSLETNSLSKATTEQKELQPIRQ